MSRLMTFMYCWRSQLSENMLNFIVATVLFDLIMKTFKKLAFSLSYGAFQNEMFGNAKSPVFCTSEVGFYPFIKK